MLKRKVIAFDIQNLTDARYFAAWGVDYLHFDLRNITLENAKQITEWVSGVDLLLSLHTFKWDEIKDHFSQSTCLIESKESKSDFLFQNTTDKTHQVLIKHKNVISLENLDTFLLLPDKYGISEINKLNQKIGLAIKGGEEDKVGLKSFEDLDKIFEALDDID